MTYLNIFITFYIYFVCVLVHVTVCVEVRGQLEDILPSTIWVPYVKPRQTLWQVPLVSHITSSKMVFKKIMNSWFSVKAIYN